MGKTRLYKLGQQMGVNTKDLITRLASLGVPGKHHMAYIDDDIIHMLPMTSEPPSTAIPLNDNLTWQRQRLLHVLFEVQRTLDNRNRLKILTNIPKMAELRVQLLSVLRQILEEANSVFTIEDLIDESYTITDRSVILSKRVGRYLRISNSDYDIIDHVEMLSEKIETIESYLDDFGLLDSIYKRNILKNNQSGTSDDFPEYNESFYGQYYQDEMDEDNLFQDIIGDEFDKNRLVQRIVDLEDSIYDINDDKEYYDTIACRLEDLETKVYGQDAYPIEFETIEKRLLKAIKKGERLQTRSLNLDYSSITRKLEEYGFFTEEDTVKEICEKLSSKMILILEGPTGTGKTILAELLPKLILGNQAEHKTEQVHADVNIDSVLGWIRMINNQPGVALGFLTKAVIKSIETDGDYWLVLDEINRGNISIALTPLLKALADKKPFLEWENMFPRSIDTSGRIPIPNTFRIIGTMNSHDKNQLHQLSHALMRRVGIVKLVSPKKEKEIQLLHSRIISEIATHRRKKITAANNKKFKESVTLLVDIANIFRKISEDQPVYLFHKAYIGSALLIDTCRILLNDILSDSDINIYNAVDTSFSKICVAHRTDWHVELCKRLISKLKSQHPITVNSIENLIRNQAI